MLRVAAILGVLVVGSGFALQAPINGSLAARVGGALPAALISFAAGTLILLVLTLLSGRADELGADPVRWHYVAGGAIGAAIVTTAAFSVRGLGAAVTVAAMVSGQLLMAVVVDYFGLLGLRRVPLSPLLVTGVVLLIAGVVCVAKARAASAVPTDPPLRSCDGGTPPAPRFQAPGRDRFPSSLQRARRRG